MEDDHVDRLDVHAQQCVELTSTNRSIELDRSHDPCPDQPGSHEDPLAEPACPLSLAGLVVEAEDVPPDPISNSAVKASSAHGTVPQGTGESVTARPAKLKACAPSSRSGNGRIRPGSRHPPCHGTARRGVEQPGSSSGS